VTAGALLRRLAQGALLLAVVSLVTFALLHAVPGGPLAAYLENPNVRPEDIARLRVALGLDAPLPVQYGRWVAGFVRGEWGFSYADGRPVLERVLERVPATLELVGASTLLALLVALPVGVVSAVHRGTDRVATVAATVGMALPVFWLGLVLQLVFALQLGWFPSSGRQSFGSTGVADRLAHLVLPATVLAGVQGAAWSRYLRRALRDTLGLPFLAAARVRGLSPARLLLRHALPNALGSGAVVTESVFAWPGAGSLFTESLAKRDYPVLMAFVMAGAAAVVTLNLLADLLVRALDPRTRAAT
jgi:peptide/nickel transport system permease protein